MTLPNGSLPLLESVAKLGSVCFRTVLRFFNVQEFVQIFLWRILISSSPVLAASLFLLSVDVPERPKRLDFFCISLMALVLC